ncbi:MAG: RNA chaperone Hfq [Sporomusaceae bacterium]|nr:RNA chaperone Hfq [Sporomusaceae bacterium]
MTTKVINLQDSFLNQVRKENVPVIIYLVNGFQLRGSVRGFDNFTVIIENEGKQQLVYKHAISTITPFRPITSLHKDETKEAFKAERQPQQ